MVVRTLQALRSNELFELLWLKVTKSAETLDVGQPQLPRHCKIPKRYDDGLAKGDFPTDPKALYRQHYFEAIDLVVNCIKDHFEQPGYEVYRNLVQCSLQGEILSMEYNESKEVK